MPLDFAQLDRIQLAEQVDGSKRVSASGIHVGVSLGVGPAERGRALSDG